MRAFEAWDEASATAEPSAAVTDEAVIPQVDVGIEGLIEESLSRIMDCL